MSPHFLSFYRKILAGITKAMTLCGNKVSKCTSHFDKDITTDHIVEHPMMELLQNDFLLGYTSSQCSITLPN